MQYMIDPMFWERQWVSPLCWCGYNTFKRNSSLWAAMESKSVVISSASPTCSIWMWNIWSLTLQPQLCLHWPVYHAGRLGGGLQFSTELHNCTSELPCVSLTSHSWTMMVCLQLMATGLSHTLLHLKVLHLLLVISRPKANVFPMHSGGKQLQWPRFPKSHHLGLPPRTKGLPGGSVHLGCPARVCLGADGCSKSTIPSLWHFFFEQYPDSGSQNGVDEHHAHLWRSQSRKPRQEYLQQQSYGVLSHERLCTSSGGRGSELVTSLRKADTRTAWGVLGWPVEGSTVENTKLYFR